MLEEDFSETKALRFPVVLVEDGSRNQYVMRTRFFDGPDLMWDTKKFSSGLELAPFNGVDIEAEMIAKDVQILKEFFENEVKNKLPSKCWVRYPIISPSKLEGHFRLHFRFGFLSE